MAHPEKPTFKSYLNESVSLREDKVKTFISYVNEGDGPPDDKSEVASNAFYFFEKGMEPKLLPGERPVAKAENVLKYSLFTERKQGISGSLYITNYKITFITADRSSYDQPSTRQRHLMLDDNDIPLTSIDTVYQGFSGGKRKRLSVSSVISGKTKYLHVYCKNFQIHHFSFKFTPKGQDKQIVNAIVAFAFPHKPQLLFALEFGKQRTKDNISLAMPMFEGPADWEDELNRLDVTQWRVAQANAKYDISDSLPEYFVVPNTLQIADLREVAPHFVDYRVPTWSYTSSCGASLVRMAYMRADSEFNYYEEKMYDAIQAVHPRNQSPVILDLGKLCPSIRELQFSFERLKELLLVDTLKDFWDTDLAWLSSIENTKWLSSVQTCLQVSLNAVQELFDKGNTVIIKENTSKDMCCVISSLTQIMLDSHYRTISGFQGLIQKEWVVMGHPFQKRSGLVTTDPPEDSPVFLLFLDCVWQLVTQFPAMFAFTEIYLTTLWDSVHTGLFSTFLFDSLYQRYKLCGHFQLNYDSLHVVNLPSLWQWGLQYSEEDRAFFNNPLYVIKTSLEFAKSLKNVHLDAKSDKVLRDTLYTKKLCKLYEVAEKEADIDDVLIPNLAMPYIKIWALCYHRWLSPAEIFDGGSPTMYLRQCLLAEELVHLKHRDRSLQRKTGTERRRPKSDLIFSVDRPDSTGLLLSSVITSSFPYTRGTDTKSRVFTPLSSYLENSNIEDYADYSE